MLSVAAAAKLSVVLPLNVKSAGATAAAVTVTVNACAAAGATVAVTTLLPPFSAISSGDSTSATDGVPSSSLIVTVG